MDAVDIALLIRAERKGTDMRLDEFEAKAAEAAAAPPVPVIEAQPVPDVEEEDGPDEWVQALDYLKQASYMLGFFSDKVLSGPITQADRERMGNLAGGIMEYVCSFTEVDSEV